MREDQLSLLHQFLNKVTSSEGEELFTKTMVEDFEKTKLTTKTIIVEHPPTVKELKELKEIQMITAILQMGKNEKLEELEEDLKELTQKTRTYEYKKAPIFFRDKIYQLALTALEKKLSTIYPEFLTSEKVRKENKELAHFREQFDKEFPVLIREIKGEKIPEKKEPVTPPDNNAATQPVTQTDKPVAQARASFPGQEPYSIDQKDFNAVINKVKVAIHNYKNTLQGSNSTVGFWRQPSEESRIAYYKLQQIINKPVNKGITSVENKKNRQEKFKSNEEKITAIFNCLEKRAPLIGNTLRHELEKQGLIENNTPTDFVKMVAGKTKITAEETEGFVKITKSSP